MSEVLRKINDMFHVDTEGYLVKTSNGQRVPDDEPLFFLRGRDNLAVETLIEYQAIAARNGCNDYLLDGVEDSIKKFRQFAAQNYDKMKQPGITRGK
jgi:hypothetical protein